MHRVSLASPNAAQRNPQQGFRRKRFIAVGRGQQHVLKQQAANILPNIIRLQTQHTV